MSFSHLGDMKKFSIIAAALFVFIFSCKAFAQQTSNIHIGALEIHPFASIKQTYNSNIYLEPDGEKNDDFITDAVLGLGVWRTLIPQREEDFMIKVSYQTDIIEYWRHRRSNRVDHAASGLLDFAFVNDFRLKIKDDFEKTAVPPDSERTSLDKRYRNTLDTTLAYDREEVRFEGGYRTIRDEYDNINNIDKTDNMFTLSSFYQIFPKTSIFTEFDAGAITYDTNETNSDSKYFQARLGAVGNLWPKLTGTVKAGYRNVKYDKRDKNDFSSFTFYGNLKYNATERTEMNFHANRTSEESSYSTNSFYEANEMEIDIKHQLSDRLWLNGKSFLEYNRYPTETTEDSAARKRKDILWGLGAKLKYEIKEWLFIGIDYEFKQRDSNFAIFDYQDHIVSTQASVTF